MFIYQIVLLKIRLRCAAAIGLSENFGALNDFGIDKSSLMVLNCITNIADNYAP